MDTTNQFITHHNSEWTTILLSLLFLVGLYFLQKYVYLIDQKLNQNTDLNDFKKQVPWPLYSAILLGLILFLYDVFSPHDINFTDDNWAIFELVFLGLGAFTVTGLTVQSIVIYGSNKGVFRTVIYLILMVLYFYAGYIAGVLIICLLAIITLIFFIKYFKNLLILK